MDYNLNEDKISKDIDKIIGKLHILRKKKELWGLTNEENTSLMNLTIEYAKNYYQLIDNIFNNYIEPFIYNDRVIEIKSELTDFYGWSGNLLCFDSNLKGLFSKINNDNKDSLILLVNELMDEELSEAIGFENNNYNKEILELFSSLQNTNKEGCVYKYIKTRYTTMISIIEEE